MTEPLPHRFEAQAQELDTCILARSTDLILDRARRLVVAANDTIFGNTEFALRDDILAYVCHRPKRPNSWPKPQGSG